VTLRNTGSQPGKEVVQLYIAPPTDATERRPSQLKAFAPVRLGAGERATVDLQLDERAFARWDVSAGAWTAEPGDHELRIGRSSRDIRLRKTISIRA
jgi:beta-glucosidase